VVVPARLAIQRPGLTDDSVLRVHASTPRKLQTQRRVESLQTPRAHRTAAALPVFACPREDLGPSSRRPVRHLHCPWAPSPAFLRAGRSRILQDSGTAPTPAGRGSRKTLALPLRALVAGTSQSVGVLASQRTQPCSGICRQITSFRDFADSRTRRSTGTRRSPRLVSIGFNSSASSGQSFSSARIAFCSELFDSTRITTWTVGPGPTEP